MRYKGDEEDLAPPARWLMVPAGLDIELAVPCGAQRPRVGGSASASSCTGEEHTGRPARTSSPAVCRHCGAPRPTTVSTVRRG
ncbi:hypothetical protein [Streptomyces sp. YIM S03343]